MPPPSSAIPTTPSRTTSSTQVTPSKNVEPNDEDDVVRAKILLLGLRRSGKTSIRRVLFDNVKPKENFIETEMSTRLSKHKIDSIIPLEVWDVPGHASPERVMKEIGVPLSTFTTLIFVIDINDKKYKTTIDYMIHFFTIAYKESQEINFEVFIHKVDAGTEEWRNDNTRIIQLRVYEELIDLASLPVSYPASPISGSSSPSVSTVEFSQMPIIFHLTSVHEHHLLQEAFSRVMTRILAPACLPSLEGLLDAFCGSSHASKTFLFDTRIKAYVATDTSPVDSVTHNFCCDFVHMLNSFGPLYKSATASSKRQEPRVKAPIQSAPSASSNANLPVPSSPSPSTVHAGSRAPTPTLTSGASPSTSIRAGTSPAAGFANLPSRSRVNSHTTTKSTNTPEVKQQQQLPVPPPKPRKPAFFPSCSTTLTPYITLTYHAITPTLALVAVLPSHVWETKRGLVEYNVVYFREGIQEIFDVELEARREKPRSSPG